MLEKLVKKFKEKRQKRKEQEEYKEKKEMCENAVKSGVCPNFCHHCAWNTRILKDEF